MRLAFASVDSKAAFLLQCGWVSSNPLRAWEAKKGWERGDPSCLPAWAGALISPAFRAGLNNWLHLGLEPPGFQSELHIELVLLCRTLTNTSVWGEGASQASIRGGICFPSDNYLPACYLQSASADIQFNPHTNLGKEELVFSHVQTGKRRPSKAMMFPWPHQFPDSTSFLTPVPGLISTGVWLGLLALLSCGEQT